jgi:hypothetical protein
MCLAVTMVFDKLKRIQTCFNILQISTFDNIDEKLKNILHKKEKSKDSIIFENRSLKVDYFYKLGEIYLFTLNMKDATAAITASYVIDSIFCQNKQK